MMQQFVSRLATETIAAPSMPPGVLAQTSQSKRAEQRKYTVFLIEDDVCDKNFILQTLLRSPYVHNVHWFSSGEELMRHFTEAGYYSANLLHRIPTLVLLDLHMPGLDGMQILQRLKDHPLTSDIPVVMVSGDSSNEAATVAYKLKANAYVPKPVHLDRIHEVMETGWSWPAHHSDGAA